MGTSGGVGPRREKSSKGTGSSKKFGDEVNAPGKRADCGSMRPMQIARWELALLASGAVNGMGRHNGGSEHDEELDIEGARTTVIYMIPRHWQTLI
jgi:hypothetical protein